MKKIVLIFLLSCFSVFSFGKEKTDKTFLVLFQKDELKKFNSNPTKIEINFLDRFDTRAYTGNSDASLLITVPFLEWDECDMGKAWVIVGDNKLVRLDEVAFRIIDLDQTKEEFRNLLSATPSEMKSDKKKSTPQKLVF
jgi:hypothetical protein